MSSISDCALRVLGDATIDVPALSVELNSGELDRTLYEEVNTVLTRLRGKWNKGSKKHIFPHNPQHVVEAVLNSGEMPPKNPTAFFPTPRKLVEDMVKIANFYDLSDCVDDFRVLEPSAGIGGIADYITELAPGVNLDLVEFLPLNQELLKAKGYQPHCGDFMEFNTDYNIKYNFIFMNPPFSLEHDKKAYITHVMHAFKMLKPCGTLMVIAPTGFLSNGTKKERDFLEFVGEYGAFYRDPPESFKESGTMIPTVTIELSTNNWKARPYQGYKNQFVWAMMLYMFNNDEKIYKRVHALYESKTFPSDESLTDCINDVIQNTLKMGEIIVEKHMDLYLERLKEDCIEHREYAGLDIPIQEVINKVVAEQITIDAFIEPEMVQIVAKKRKKETDIGHKKTAEIIDKTISKAVYVQFSLF